MFTPFQQFVLLVDWVIEKDVWKCSTVMSGEPFAVTISVTLTPLLPVFLWIKGLFSSVHRIKPVLSDVYVWFVSLHVCSFAKVKQKPQSDIATQRSSVCRGYSGLCPPRVQLLQLFYLGPGIRLHNYKIGDGVLGSGPRQLWKATLCTASSLDWSD